MKSHTTFTEFLKDVNYKQHRMYGKKYPSLHMYYNYIKEHDKLFYNEIQFIKNNFHVRNTIDQLFQTIINYQRLY